MGRPLNKRYFGSTQVSPGGADRTNEERLTVSVKVGANTATALGIILNQRSETKFTVSDDPDAVGGNAVYIRKVQNRTMIDFDDNRYTWAIEDDSTANILVLTAI
jgi:hypothetical protein